MCELAVKKIKGINTRSMKVVPLFKRCVLLDVREIFLPPVRAIKTTISTETDDIVKQRSNFPEFVLICS